MNAKSLKTTELEGPESLVAILVAAKRAGFRPLERRTKKALEQKYGIKVSFASSMPKNQDGKNK